MNYRKILRNVKAISPIISTLLLIAIAVVASLVAYAWVMGYIGFQTAKTGQAVQIQSVSDQGNVLTVYVQNIGQAPISFNIGSATTSASCVFVNGQAVAITTSTPAAGTNGQITNVAAGNTVTFVTSFVPIVGQPVVVKVNSVDGTFNSMTYTFTS